MSSGQVNPELADETVDDNIAPFPGDNIARILNKERRSLLDLTARNRLLNVPRRNARSKTLEIIDERADEVFRILAGESKTMYFMPVPDSAEAVKSVANDPDADQTEEAQEEFFEGLPQPANEELDELGRASRHTDMFLQTPHQSEKLQKRLLGLYYDARTYEEEQGVNILYLAVGFLKWFEDETSEKERWAPLILIPVSLVRDSVGERFKLSFTEDEISTNLSLKEKLQHDFGIKLPELSETDDIVPSDYCEEVRKAVSQRKRWEVVTNDMVLGFFSFSKFLMYRDLDPKNWPNGSLQNHEIIGGLLAGEGFSHEELLFGDDEKIDPRLDPKDVFHVVDCDSSQAAAIEEVRTGRNLIIQGPPGTGKSQTITNLIAAAVQDGKTVLFLAEKLAALDVVKRRLETIGLGDICLELHSHKSNKKQVLADIANTLNLGAPRSPNAGGQASTLRSVRDDLNSFVEKLHKAITPSMLTPYQILGMLVKTNALGLKDMGFNFSDDLKWTYEDIQKRAEALESFSHAIEQVGTPAKNPWRGAEIGIALPDDLTKLKTMTESLLRDLTKFTQDILSLGNEIGLSPELTLSDCWQRIIPAALTLHEAPQFDYQPMKSGAWDDASNDVWTLIETGLGYTAEKNKIEGKIADAAWDINVAETRIALAASAGSFLRFFTPSYLQARRFLKGIMKIKVPSDDQECITILDALMAAQKARRIIEEKSAAGEKCFGSFWRKENSPWPLFNDTGSWKQTMELYYQDNTYLDKVLDRNSTSNLKDKADSIVKLGRSLEKDLESLVHFLKLNVKNAFSADGLNEVSFRDLLKRLEAWYSNPETLTKWIGFCNSWKFINALGLDILPQKAYDGEIQPSMLRYQFRHILYSQIFRSFAAQNPEFASFEGETHEQKLEKFRMLDWQRIELSRNIVATTHYEGLPKGAQAIGGVGIIRGEIQKKRKHMPVRKLTAAAGTALQKIKPIFMMSPMSVAQFLEPGAVNFDLLLIDEASQVQPIDALGAIARSKQIVVVGDSKQLPPTSFFMVADSSSDEDGDGASAGDMESILGLCEKQNMPNRMLRWHYRSKHHSLIAFSNDEFYDNRLFIVPSPFPSNDNLGLHFIKVDGVYDRGNTATNRIEAKAVAQACIDHARNHPDKTLGVGAFSMRQQQAIIDELEHLYRQCPDVHDFFSRNEGEPFFVKNLENIQGDERDVILLSIGYARDESGYMAMNFGPLTREGGQRRLNVLVTRARQKCVIFSSITADDIDLARTSSVGVAALKQFLSYAQTGKLPSIELTGKDFDSDFEESVAKVLQQYGYKVEPQLGVAGFFIDLAVSAPENPSRFLLGVECDGLAYHSSRSARDRDRLRQQVLENHGWKIHRIWSTDWFYRPQAETQKLLAALEVAKQSLNKPKEIVVPVEAVPVITRTELDLFDEGAETIWYEEADFAVERKIEPHNVVPGRMTDIVTQIIQVEGPIHKEEIARRVAALWGLQRAGNRILAAVTESIRRSQKRDPKAVLVEGDFCRYVDVPIIVRNRSKVSSVNLKKPQMIAPVEIEQGVLDAITEYAGVSIDDAVLYISRKLGFQKASAQLRDRIIQAVDDLLAEQKIKNSDGRLDINI